MLRIVFTFCIIINTISLSAQPGTEIFLFDVKTKNGKMILSNPRNITNHIGYDNQPSFHPEKPIIYYASANDEGRTDIVQYNYKTNQRNAITKSHEREYSPTVTPDKKFISCILQRDSGAQDLVKYPIDGGDARILIDDEIVGYHAWIDANNIVVFTLPQPFKLLQIDLVKKTKFVVAENIGRSLHRIPKDDAISYTQKVAENHFNILRYNPTDKTSSVISSDLKNADGDMCWTSSGKILATLGNKIIMLDQLENTWKEVEIKSENETRPFTRLAMSPDGKILAVVVME
jgi:hypothetical protein